MTMKIFIMIMVFMNIMMIFFDKMIIDDDEDLMWQCDQGDITLIKE